MPRTHKAVKQLEQRFVALIPQLIALYEKEIPKIERAAKRTLKAGCRYAATLEEYMRYWAWEQDGSIELVDSLLKQHGLDYETVQEMHADNEDLNCALCNMCNDAQCTIFNEWWVSTGRSAAVVYDELPEELPEFMRTHKTQYIPWSVAVRRG